MRRLLSLFLCVLLCFSIPFGSGVVASASENNPNGNPDLVIGVGNTLTGITDTQRGDVYGGVTMKAFPVDISKLDQNDKWLYISFKYEFDDAFDAYSDVSFTHNIPNGITAQGSFAYSYNGTSGIISLTNYYAIWGMAGFTYLYINGEYFGTYDGAYGLTTRGDYGEIIESISLPSTQFETEVYSIEFRYLFPLTAFQRIINGMNQGDMLQKLELYKSERYLYFDWGRYSSSVFSVPGGSFVYESNLSNTGLLSALSGWLNGIIQALNNILNSISSGFSNVVSAITSLPQKLWTLIENGLKALFVPTEEQLQEYHDKWSELMSDRFGALYQCMDLVDQFFTDIQDYSTTGVIEMPGVTVDLAGTPWTFGGYDIDVVPDGFDFLADSLKLIVDIVCTLAFINAMKNRFERLLGG